MNLRDLKYIVALADHRHFRKAAEAAFVSPSTLSIQVKQLEDELGMTLFDRSLTPIRPTEKALPVIESARRILAEIEQIRHSSRGISDPLDVTLRLGIIPTLAPYFLPHAMQVLQKHCQPLRVLLLELQTPDLLLQLHQGSIDAGMLALPIDDQQVVSLPIFDEPFVVTYPKFIPQAHHRLLADAPGISIPAIKTKSTKPIAPTDMHVPRMSAEKLTAWFSEHQQLSMLLLEEGHCLRGQALSACKLSDPTAEPVRATSLETLRQMVAQRLGWTLLPFLATFGLAFSDPRLGYQPLKPSINRRIALIHRPKSPHASTLELLASVWREHLPDGVSAVKP